MQTMQVLELAQVGDTSSLWTPLLTEARAYSSPSSVNCGGITLGAGEGAGEHCRFAPTL